MSQLPSREPEVLRNQAFVEDMQSSACGGIRGPNREASFLRGGVASGIFGLIVVFLGCSPAITPTMPAVAAPESIAFEWSGNDYEWLPIREELRVEVQWVGNARELHGHIVWLDVRSQPGRGRISDIDGPVAMVVDEATLQEPELSTRIRELSERYPLGLILTDPTDAMLEHLRAFPHLRALSLMDNPDRPAVSDAGIRHLSGLHELESLGLQFTAITDAGLSELGGLLHLERLSLVGSGELTDEALSQVAGLVNLRSLDISGCPQITGSTFRSLSRLVVLEELELGFTQVGDTHLAALRALPALSSLGLDSTPVSNVGMRSLPPSLRSLNLSGTHVTDVGLEDIARLESLEVLYLAQTSVQGPGLAHLTSLQHLRILGLYSTPLSTGLEFVSRITSIEELNLSRTELPESQIAMLRDAAGLRSLNLAMTRLDGAVLSSLAGHPHLETLIVPSSTDNDDLKTLYLLPALRHLDLSMSLCDGYGLPYVRAIEALETLNLSHCRILDEHLSHLTTRLQSPSRLQSLNLSHTNISDVGVRLLASLGQLQTLVLTGNHRVTDESIPVLSNRFVALTTVSLRDTAISTSGLRRLSRLHVFQ